MEYRLPQFLSLEPILEIEIQDKMFMANEKKASGFQHTLNWPYADVLRNLFQISGNQLFDSQATLIWF